MTNWCYGDDWLCQRAGRAWPIERLAEMLGKTRRAIRERFPDAGCPRELTEQQVQAIATLLPGRSVATVGRLLGLTPEDIAATAEREGWLQAYDMREAGTRHPHEDVPAMLEMRAQGLTSKEIGACLGRSAAAVNRAIQYAGKASRKLHRFTAEEDAQILRLTDEGLSQAQVGKALGFTRSQVASRRRWLKNNPDTRNARVSG